MRFSKIKTRPESGSGFVPGPLGSCAARAFALIIAVLVVACACLSVPMVALAKTEAAVTEEGSALNEEAGIGLVGFKRYQKGALRPVGDIDLGYRYPLPDHATLVALATNEAIIVYVDRAAAEEVGLDLENTAQRDALIALVEYLDEEASRGGTLIADIAADREVIVTDEQAMTIGSYTYRFAVDAGEGRYCSVQPATLSEGEEPTAAAEAAGLDLSAGALWCDGARLVPASEVPVVAAPGLLEQLGTFFSGVDYQPFWVSLKTSAVALVITFVLGLLAAWRTMGTSSRLKGILDSVFTIPMVLPPTVCGFLLLLLFGQSTPVGQWLIAHGISIVFTWEAAVISAIVVSFPLMYRTALGAFESLDATMLDAARTLGWSETRIFARLMMPLAWPSIAAGTVLAFARAMGEFGCTLFFAGNYAGVTQTIPIAIYFEWMSGNTDVALFWVVVVILFSFIVVLVINLYTAHSQRYRERDGARQRLRGRDVEPVAAPEAGGDALRIDREALRSLIAESESTAAEGRR